MISRYAYSFLWLSPAISKMHLSLIWYPILVWAPHLSSPPLPVTLNSFWRLSIFHRHSDFHTNGNCLIKRHSLLTGPHTTHRIETLQYQEHQKSNFSHFLEQSNVLRVKTGCHKLRHRNQYSKRLVLPHKSWGFVSSLGTRSSIIAQDVVQRNN